MSLFFRKFQECLTSRADALAVGDNVRKWTYRELDESSWKVARYLKEKNVGREQFVVIELSRGVEILGAIMGVWKAGAAVVVLEKGGPKARETVILENTHSHVIIDSALWNQIQNGEKLDGWARFENPDLHDAALVVYTSGSTGKPKGIIHEFGTLDLMVRSNSFNEMQEPILSENDRMAMISPLGFIGAMFMFVWAVSRGAYFAVVPNEIVKNPMEMQRFLREENITFLFGTPSYLAAFNGNFEQVKRLYIGAEMVQNIHYENMDMFTTFGSSEVGSAVTVFKIDKPYERTPVGKSYCGVDVDLAPDGELKVFNPYCRGYVSDAALTEKTFRNGWVYTGDIAKKLPDGNFQLLGRKDEMAKIDGNRIEPGEIEWAVKKALGISWASVKIFKDEIGTAVICAYFIENIEIDYALIYNKLSVYLPYYMMPHHFVHLDSIPRNANGKLDRMALKLPDERNLHHLCHIPKNREEAELCKVMAEVLHKNIIGVDDDFFEWGGSSILAMNVLMSLNWPNFNTSYIFEGRTPRKIAQIYLEKRPGELMALKSPSPVFPMSQYMLEEENLASVDSTMYLLDLFVELKSHVTESDLQVALDKVMDAHPLFNSCVHVENDVAVWEYHPDWKRNVEIFHIAEKDLDGFRKEFYVPLKIYDSFLYRIGIVKTETHLYLAMITHQAFADGYSLHVFSENLKDALYGNVIPWDDFYSIAQRRSFNKSEMVTEREFYEQRFEGLMGYDRYPKTDMEKSGSDGKYTNVISAISFAQIKDMAGKRNVSVNEFFIAVTLMALHRFNRSPKVAFTWGFNGRMDKQEMESIGNFLCEFPIVMDFSKIESPSNLLECVKQQVREVLSHWKYPYTLKHCPRKTLCLLYQHGVNLDALYDCAERVEFLTMESKRAQNIFDVEIWNVEGNLQFHLNADMGCYTQKSVDRFGATLVECVKEFI